MNLNKLIKLERALFEDEEEEVILTHEEQVEKELCEASFYEFVKTFWFDIAQCKYRDGWHVEAFCDHLQTMHMGGFQDLVYNAPFRSGKSIVLAIALPAWIWTDDPTESFLYSSYKMSLSERDSKACNAFVKSSKYQKYWGHYVKIDKRYDNVNTMQLIAGGVRRITSVERPTGFGANWIIQDDGNAILGAKSNLSYEKINWTYDNVMSSRFKLLEDRKRVIGQQRSNVQDVSGHVLSKANHRWVHVKIPEEFKPISKCVTVPLWNTREEPWEDPRTEEDELMWPSGRNREDLDYLKEVDFNNDSYVIAGQLQQEPFPEGGGMIKRDWFMPWTQGDYPWFELIMQSWDTALTGNTTSAYSACTTWGLWRNEQGVGNVMLLSLYKGHLEGPDLRWMAKRLYQDYDNTFFIPKDERGPDEEPDLRVRPHAGTHQERRPRAPDLRTHVTGGGAYAKGSMYDVNRRPLQRQSDVNFVLIESKASGFDLAASLKDAGINTYGFNPTPYGGKIQRARRTTYLMENGRVWLPTQAPKFEMFSKMSQEFIGACESFPNDQVNDIVDSTSQALIFLDQGGWLKRDDETPPMADPYQQDFHPTGRLYKEKGL